MLTFSLPKYMLYRELDIDTVKIVDMSMCVICFMFIISRNTHTRDGPKFGERRSSAEEFGRTFGSVRLGNM